MGNGQTIKKKKKRKYFTVSSKTMFMLTKINFVEKKINWMLLRLRSRNAI